MAREIGGGISGADLNLSFDAMMERQKEIDALERRSAERQAKKSATMRERNAEIKMWAAKIAEGKNRRVGVSEAARRIHLRFKDSGSRVSLDRIEARLLKAVISYKKRPPEQKVTEKRLQDKWSGLIGQLRVKRKHERGRFDR